MSDQTAKKAPGFLKNSVIYQINLRAFTPGGTLKSAEAMLPHIASLGVDLVYLCPVFLADDDPREEFWSERQRKSGFGNPQNMYRMKDYYSIDPEYGTNDDLKSFVRTAHNNNLRVLLDLVYYHCGPTAVFIEEHPDFVVRDENGAVKNGLWHFPELNFASPALREYLWRNMEYFVREFDVDGYRCDVSSEVPLDFWEEGRRRIDALKPGIVMLAESFGGCELEQRAAFDMQYCGIPYIACAVLAGEKPASELRREHESQAAGGLTGARFIRSTDNHDISNDEYECRTEKLHSAGVEAALAFCFLIDGIPFLYNGQEIADSRRHSIFSNRFHGGGYIGIDWSNAATPHGKHRMAFIRRMIELRRRIPALAEGRTVWLDNPHPESVLTFRREGEGESIAVAVNFGREAHSLPLDGRWVIDCGGGAAWCDGRAELPPDGYLILRA